MAYRMAPASIILRDSGHLFTGGGTRVTVSGGGVVKPDGSVVSVIIEPSKNFQQRPLQDRNGGRGGGPF